MEHMHRDILANAQKIELLSLRFICENTESFQFELWFESVCRRQLKYLCNEILNEVLDNSNNEIKLDDEYIEGSWDDILSSMCTLLSVLCVCHPPRRNDDESDENIIVALTACLRLSVGVSKIVVSGSSESSKGRVLYDRSIGYVQYVMQADWDLVNPIITDCESRNAVFSFLHIPGVPTIARIFVTPLLDANHVIFTCTTVQAIVSSGLLDKVVNSLGVVSPDDLVLVLEILCGLTSGSLCCPDAEGFRSEVLSTVCSFEVNRTLLRACKDALLSSTMLTSSTPTSLLSVLSYLSLCRTSGLAYSVVSPTLENVRLMIMQPSLASDKTGVHPEAAQKGCLECTEVIQVVIDLSQRMLTTLENSKRQRRTSDTQVALSDCAQSAVQVFLTGAARLLSTMIAARVDFLGRPLSRRLPLSALVNAPLDIVTEPLFNEVCAGIAAAMLSSGQAPDTSLDPQLSHLYQQCHLYAGPRSDCLAGFLLLATATVLSRDSSKIQMMVDANVHELCLHVLGSPVLCFTHTPDTLPTLSVVCRLAALVISSLVVCIPSILPRVVQDLRLTKFIYDILRTSLSPESSISRRNDLCTALQLWVVLVASVDVQLVGRRGEEVDKVFLEISTKLLSCVFSVISGTKDVVDACHLYHCSVLARTMRVVLTAMGLRIYSARVLRRSLGIAAEAINRWLGSKECVGGGVLESLQWMQLSECTRESDVEYVLRALQRSLLAKYDDRVAEYSTLSYRSPSWCSSLPLTSILGCAVTKGFASYKGREVWAPVYLKEILSLAYCFCLTKQHSVLAPFHNELYNTEYVLSTARNYCEVVKESAETWRNCNAESIELFTFVWSNVLCVNTQDRSIMGNDAAAHLTMPLPFIAVEWVMLCLRNIETFISADVCKQHVDVCILWVKAAVVTLSSLREGCNENVHQDLVNSGLCSHLAGFCLRYLGAYKQASIVETSPIVDDRMLFHHILETIEVLCERSISTADVSGVLSVMCFAVSSSDDFDGGVSSDMRTELLSWGYRVLLTEKRRQGNGVVLHHCRQHLSSPAWCLLRSDPSSDMYLSSYVLARNVLAESISSHENISAERDRGVAEKMSPLWPPVESGYTMSVWFSIMSIESNSSECNSMKCIFGNKCGTQVHYELFRVYGNTSAAWPDVTVYVCRGSVCVAISSNEKTENGEYHGDRVNSNQVVVFESLPEVEYDGAWHHLVVRHHTNRPSRPFIVATLDGLTSEEHPMFLLSSRPPSNSACGYSISSAVICPSLQVSSEIPRPHTLSLGPMLLVRKPLSTSQVAAIFGAGPFYDGVFGLRTTLLPGGEGGEVPLHMSYTSLVLTESIIRSIKTGTSPAPKGHTTSYSKGTLNSLPSVLHSNIYTDPELNTTDVIFSMSSRWQPYFPLSTSHSGPITLNFDSCDIVAFDNTDMHAQLADIVQRRLSDNASKLTGYESYCATHGGNKLHALCCNGAVVVNSPLYFPFTNSSMNVVNFESLFHSVLRLLSESLTPVEASNATLLAGSLLLHFPCARIGLASDTYFASLVSLLREKIAAGFMCMDLVVSIAALPSCDSYVSRSSNLRRLWYGQSQYSLTDSDRACLGDGDIMLSHNSVLTSPDTLCLLVQECMIISRVTPLQLETFLTSLLSCQLHPLSRFAQVNRCQFQSSGILSQLLFRLCDTSVTPQKKLVSAEFIMRLIESDFATDSDYELLLQILLLLCSQSKSILRRFLLSVTSSTQDPADFDSIDIEAHVAAQFCTLRRYVAAMLLQAANGFYAVSKVGSNNINYSDSQTCPSLRRDDSEATATGKVLLLSSLHDSSSKSLSAITAAVPMELLLYILHRTVGVQLLADKSQLQSSRVLLLSMTAPQDLQCGVIIVLLLSNFMHSSRQSGNLSASAIQQYIIELELYIPLLLFALLNKITSSAIDRCESESGGEPTVSEAVDSKRSSGTPSGPIRQTSLFFGNRFLSFEGLYESNPKKPRPSSASSVLFNTRESLQYFPSFKKLAHFVDEGSPVDWLVRLIEGILDITFGYPGATRDHMSDLLEGWSLAEIEPSYTPPPHVLTLVPCPHGMCIGISVLMKSAIEAARFSTACSLMFVSGMVAEGAEGRQSIPQLREWTEKELVSASSNARSACLTILCSLYSLLERSGPFRKYLFQPSMTQVHWVACPTDKKKSLKKIQRFTLLDVLMIGAVHVFYAAAKSRLMEMLGSRAKIEEALSSFEAGLQMPYDLVYLCCGTTIGRACLQLLVFVSTGNEFSLHPYNEQKSSDDTTEEAQYLLSQTEREHAAVAVKNALHTPDMCSVPYMPKSVSRLVSLVLNAAYRRRVLHMHHLHSTFKSEEDEIVTQYTSSSTVQRRVACRTNLEHISDVVLDIVELELELSSLASGSIADFIDSRVFESISMLMDITTFACTPLRLPENSHSPPNTENTGAPSASPSAEPSGTFRSFGFTGFMNNLKGQFKEATGDDSKGLAGPVPRSMLGGFLKKNLGMTILSNSVDDAFKRENRIIADCLFITVNVIRAVAILLLEKLREKSQLRRSVLTFLIKYKYYFFREIPKGISKGVSMGLGNVSHDKAKTKDRDLDFEFTSALCFYFYQCMHEDDLGLRVIAMKCWGEVFRSELAQHASDLLVVHISNAVSSDVVLQMKVDLWKYEKGGLCLLEQLVWSSPPTAATIDAAAIGRRHSISLPSHSAETAVTDHPVDVSRIDIDAVTRDEAYVAFVRWMDDLSEDIRDAFETRICESADRMRQEVVSARADHFKTRREQNYMYIARCNAHAEELYLYMAQLIKMKRKEARRHQRNAVISLSGRFTQWQCERIFGEHMRQQLLESCGSCLLGKTSDLRVCHKKHLTVVPPPLTGRYQSDFGWKGALLQCRGDDNVEGHEFLCIESKEVESGSGEWALDFSEDSLRMRRRIRRGTLVLHPVYTSCDGVEKHDTTAAVESLYLRRSSAVNEEDLIQPSTSTSHAVEKTAITQVHLLETQDSMVDSIVVNEVAATLNKILDTLSHANVALDDLVDTSSDSQKVQMDTNVVEIGDRIGASESPRSCEDDFSDGSSDGDDYAYTSLQESAIVNDLAPAVSLQEATLDLKLSGSFGGSNTKVMRKVRKRRRRRRVGETLFEHDSIQPVTDEESIAYSNIVLLPGDSVIFKCTCKQVMGMDSKRVMCVVSTRKNLYVLDMANNCAAPTVSSDIDKDDYDITTNDVSLSTTHGGWSAVGEGESIGSRVRYWPLSAIRSVQHRRYLLLPKAIEIFLIGGKCLFLRFSSTHMVDEFVRQLSSYCPSVPPRGGLPPSAFSPNPQRISDDGSLPPHHRLNVRRRLEHGRGAHSSALAAATALSACQEKWIHGEMSNFEYLMHLNNFAGRSFNDWGQYPVFPWVLQDYHSSTLDLTSPEVFRDLSKPMGALTELRRQEAMDKFLTLSQQFDCLEKGTTGSQRNPADVSATLARVSARPFHYGTHYSTPAIVLHYLVRLQPFASHAVVFQGDKFDNPDRLFQSIRHSWMSASGGISDDPSTHTSNMQDVKELTPEFFYLPDFLCNVNQYEFGTNSSGTTISDVELPPWAEGSPSLFIQKHRAALESEHVSRNLHHWIDLIFGYKQTGEEAVKANNVFRYLSYASPLDIMEVENDIQRAAYSDEICNFGQTPSQLFTKRHPPRRVHAGRELEASLRVSLTCGSEAGEIGRTSLDSYPSSSDTKEDLPVRSNHSATGSKGTLSEGDLEVSRMDFAGVSLADPSGKDSSRGMCVNRHENGNMRMNVKIIQSPCEVIASTHSLESSLSIQTRLIPINCRYIPRMSSTYHIDDQPTGYSGRRLGEVSSIYTVGNTSLVGVPRHSLLIPSRGRNHIVLAYGFLDCTFRVMVCPIGESHHQSSTRNNSWPISSSQSLERTEHSANASETAERGEMYQIDPSSSLSGRLLRGFDSKDKSHSPTSTTSLPARNDNEVQGIPASFSILDASTQSSWRQLCSFDHSEVTVSCAALGGMSATEDRCVIVTGHRYAGFVHIWSLDTAALVSAADGAWLSHSISQALRLLQVYSTPWHTGGIVDISTGMRLEDLYSGLCSGSFATVCEGCHVVLWDFSFSAEMDSAQSVPSSYCGVQVYPLEDIWLSSPQPERSTSCRPLERAHYLTVDPCTEDVYVCLDGRVVVFDPNGRIKACAEDNSKDADVSALCAKVLHIDSWERTRAFLVGYSDGSVCMWGMRHSRDVVRFLCSDTDEQSCGELACRDPSFLSGRNAYPDEYLRRMLDTAECEECPQTAHFVTQTASGVVSCEYTSFPILKVQDMGRSSTAITTVRLSPAWDFIIAGRADGSIIRWKIRNN